jgi:hypothetical protein
MKDTEQTQRQIALCCLGEQYLTYIARGDVRQGLSFEDLKTLYMNAKNAGREDALRVIRKEIENRLPWTV